MDFGDSGGPTARSPRPDARGPGSRRSPLWIAAESGTSQAAPAGGRGGLARMDSARLAGRPPAGSVADVLGLLSEVLADLPHPVLRPLHGAAVVPPLVRLILSSGRHCEGSYWAWVRSILVRWDTTPLCAVQRMCRPLATPREK